MTQLGNDLKIRPAVGTDLNFIFDTFKESLRSDSSLGRSCKASVFKKEFAQVIDYILETSKVLIACYASNENTILGYLIFEPGIIHYAFTKRAFRKMGIQSALIESAWGPREDIQCSFKTRMVRDLFERKQFLIHNPFINFKKGVSHG